MRQPDINDYPEWLHEYIKTELYHSGDKDANCMNELQMAFTRKRIDPVAKLLFYLSVEVIRQKFTIWTLKQLVFASREFTKEEIQALKICAAEKIAQEKK